MRRKSWHVLLCVAASGVLLILRAYAQNPGSKPVLSAAVQEHLKEIAEGLPPDSLLRDGLEHGGHGDGIYHAWMDEMRQQGIRRALVSTEFVWHKKPTDIKVTKLVYFSTYEGDCNQISDPARLSKIRSSGLEAELSNQAVQDTLQGHWMFIDHAPHHLKRGVTTITLMDDEWLPTLPISFVQRLKEADPFKWAVGTGDVAAATAFLREGVSAQERDGAVWAMTGVPRPCTLKALLQAGADPNMRDRYGSPLLTEEIRRDNFENAKVLVEAGADVNAKDARGFTPLSTAEGIEERLEEAHTPALPAMPDIIRLLKAAGAHD
jgi:hypothetical protein